MESIQSQSISGYQVLVVNHVEMRCEHRTDCCLRDQCGGLLLSCENWKSIFFLVIFPPKSESKTLGATTTCSHL